MPRKIARKAKAVIGFSAKLFVMISVIVSQAFTSGAYLALTGGMPAAKAASSPTITTYVVPAISNTKILPNSSISSSYKSKSISAQASRGEYKALSFVVNSDQAIDALQVEATDLTGGGKTIPQSAVDIKAVKLWYQAGYGTTSNHAEGRYLTPELLLKDDSLIKVEGKEGVKYNESDSTGKNYLKLTNGSYVDISSSICSDTEKDDDTTHKCTQSVEPSFADRPVQDAATLQPVQLPAKANKQFWITLHVPDDATAADYAGAINLKSGNSTIASLKLNLTVLSINLPQPDEDYSVYYRGKIRDEGMIGSESKTAAQYTAEQEDMHEHGVTKPTMFNVKSDDYVKQELSIRQKAGMNNSDIYYIGNAKYDERDQIARYKNLGSAYGVQDVYLYGLDEDSVVRSTIEGVHAAGGKYFNSQDYTQANSVADILDLAVVETPFSASLAKTYHGYGHKIYGYGMPQTVPEYPRLYRMNYGLALWQAGYDGAMPYAYQHSMGDIWNDFDYKKENSTYRDHVFAYPTMNGVVDTVQWEGFREGINDMRYLAALEDAISTAKEKGQNDIAAEAASYLDKLKISSLTKMDLDDVRAKMVSYILACTADQPIAGHSLTINSGTGSGIYVSGEKVAIKANAAPQGGLEFDKWTGDTKYVSSINSSSATVTMPDKAISLTATYKSSWYDKSYSYRKSIVVNNEKIAGSEDHVNFPLLVSVTDSSLKSSSNGGKMQNTNGYDLVFTLPDKTVLPYEVEAYDNAKGKLVAWVKIPKLYVSADTVIYMYYGNSAVSTSQENKTAVWNSSFKGVWHLAEKDNIKEYKDSTSNANNAASTSNNPAAGSGQIDKAQSFDGSSSYLNFGNKTGFSSPSLTLSFWMKMDDNGRIQRIINKGDVNAGTVQSGYEVLYAPSTGELGFWVNGTSKALARYKFTNFGKWVFITATTESGSTKIYENGVLKLRIAAVTSDFSNSYNLYAGVRQTLAKDQMFNGSLDEFRLSDTVRSAEWIQTEYNNQSAPSTFFTVGSEEGQQKSAMASLTVTNGTGSGLYAEGAKVTITADNAPAGKTFSKWTGDTKYVANTASSAATVTMPNKSIALTATYKETSTQKYSLTVTNGTGSGSYAQAAQIGISANAASSGKTFDKWTGNTEYVADPASATTTVTMPAKSVTLVASYRTVPSEKKYTLTVKSGTGSGSYTEGSKVTITANAAISEKVFNQWTGDVKYVSDVNSATATVTMPAKAITLTAIYKTIPSEKKYLLTIKNGSGSGSYTQGTKVAVSADAAPAGKTFDKWKGDTKYVADPSAITTTVTMPNKAITLTAIYKSLSLTQSLKATVTSQNTTVKKGAADITLVEASLANTGTETLSVSGLGIMADYGSKSINNVKLYIDGKDMGSPSTIKVYEVIYKSLPLQIEPGKSVKLVLKGDVSSSIKLKGLGFRLDSCTNIFTVKGTTTGKKAKLSVSGKSYLYFTSK